MSEWDYSWDYGGSAPYDDWSWDAGAMPGGFTPDYSYDYGGTQPYDNWSGSGGAGALSLEDQVRQAIAQRPDLYGSASTLGGWGSSVLGALGSVGSFLGKNASTLGPLLSGAGSIAGGAIGSNAANEAARLQAEALNRGIDLSTSQWLQQLERTAPWVEAGQQSLGTLQGLAGQQLPGLPGQMASIDPRAYGMPDATPRWTPQGYQGPANVNAGDYRWNPQAGPQAANFRYAPGAVPTLSGQELLANDPGVAFRLGEGRKALEASAAAKGGLLSGPTLAALQRQGQELGSQEYGNAWNRASQQAQLREQWNQTASQLGFNQAQAEAAWREQMAGQSQAQNWGQALQGQQTGFNQGLESQKWLQTQNQLASDQLYNRNWDQYKTTIGLDQARNATDYERQQAAYKQQLAQHLLPWEQQSTLSQLGAQVTGQLGNQSLASSSGISNLLSQLGSVQGGGAAGSGLMWNRALTGAANQLPSILAGLNA